MPRRGLALALLALLAVPLVGSIAYASVCLVPCPEEEERAEADAECPPVCALCTSCTPVQVTIAAVGSAGAPLVAAHDLLDVPPLDASDDPAGDIFHVPLAA